MHCKRELQCNHSVTVGDPRRLRTTERPRIAVPRAQPSEQPADTATNIVILLLDKPRDGPCTGVSWDTFVAAKANATSLQIPKRWVLEQDSSDVLCAWRRQVSAILGDQLPPRCQQLYAAL